MLGKMKEVEIVNGKFNLEGTVVDADILGLESLHVNNYTPSSILIEKLEKSKSNQFTEMSDKKINEAEVIIKGNKGKELKLINEKKPEDADAYARGDMCEINHNEGKYPGEDGYSFAVVYLKLKD